MKHKSNGIMGNIVKRSVREGRRKEEKKRRESYPTYENEMYPVSSFPLNQLIFPSYILPGA
jgi:hypothetical protein